MEEEPKICFDEKSYAFQNEEIQEFLREMFDRLGIGQDGYLSLKELEVVCQAIGMEKLASEVTQQLFSKLDVARDGQISFEEFLSIFQSGKLGDFPIIHQKFNPPQETSVHSSCVKVTPIENASSHTLSSDFLTLSSLDFEGTGWANVAQLVDAWHSVGLRDGLLCLKKAGLPHMLGQEISLRDLSQVLEEEIRSQLETGDMRHRIYLSSILHEMFSLRANLESAEGERDKLRHDLNKVNDRFALLAQELDDHNTKMEKNYNQHLSELENTYKGQIFQLQESLKRERENEIDSINYQTEELSSENAFLKKHENEFIEHISILKKDISRLESENQNLISTLNESEMKVKTLDKQLNNLTDLESKASKHESLSTCEEQLESSLAKINELKNENQHLRDTNDELIAQIESLSTKPSYKNKDSPSSTLGDYFDRLSEDNIVDVRKRSACWPPRNFCSDELTGSEFGGISPLRSVKAMRTDHSDRPVNFLNISQMDESFLDESVCSYRKSSSPISFTEEVDSSLHAAKNVCTKCNELKCRLNVALKELEMSLKREKQNFIQPITNEPIIVETSSNNNNNNIDDLVIHKCLEDIAKNIKSKLDENFPLEELRISSPSRIRRFSTIPEEDENTSETGEAAVNSLLKEFGVVESEVNTLHRAWTIKTDKLEREKAHLEDQCGHMEREIQYLKVEREKSDDYWNMKFQEEQDYYEGERQMYDEKFSALEAKIEEYESMAQSSLSSQTSLIKSRNPSESSDERLSTIDESALWERQVTELEDEIINLKAKITKLEQENANSDENWTQLIENKKDEFSRLSNCLEMQLKDAKCRVATLEQQLSTVHSEFQNFRKYLDNEAEMQEFANTILDHLKNIRLANKNKQSQGNQLQSEFANYVSKDKCSECDGDDPLHAVCSFAQSALQMYKEQVKKVAKADILICELYKENAELMSALQVTEKRQKSAELQKMKIDLNSYQGSSMA